MCKLDSLLILVSLEPAGKAGFRLEESQKKGEEYCGCGARAPGEASSGVWVLSLGGFVKDKQRRRCGGWEAGDGKSVVIKESERFGEERRRARETEKPGEEFSAVCAAIKEYDRYKSL